MKKVFATIASLLMLIAILIIPVAASASSGVWPVSTEAFPGYIKAYNDGSVFVGDNGMATSAETDSSDPGFAEVSSGPIKYSSGIAANHGGSDPTAMSVMDIGYTSTYIAKDGTAYLAEALESGDYITAEKNGRHLWSRKVSSSSCYAPYGNDPYYINMGGDGNIYAMLTSSACGTALFELNAATGATIGTPYRFTEGTAPLFTYGGEVMIGDSSTGKYLYFANGDTSSPSDSTDFPVSYVSGPQWTDASESLYDVYTTGTRAFGCGLDLDYWVKPRAGTASTYSFDTIDDCMVNGDNAALLPNHGFVSLQTPSSGDSTDPTLAEYNIPSSGTVMDSTSITASTPSGYMEDAGRVYADTNGKVLYVSRINDGFGHYDVLVRLFDFSSNTVSIIWRASDHISGQSSLRMTADGSLYGGYLYAAICGDSCSSNRRNADIYKIELTGFGDEYQNSGSFGTPAQTDTVNYVALGDSYSSGEGVPPFIYGTDGTFDTCHRSQSAYAELLEQNYTSLHLNLVQFAACSGATTNDYFNVNTHTLEASQDSNIDSSTGVVTLSLGGNDVGFADDIKTCIDNSKTTTDCVNAVDASIVIINSSAFKTKLEQVYADVLNRGNTGTQLFVVGYPNIFPSNAYQDSTCTWGFLGSELANIRDDQVTESEVDAFRTAASNLQDQMIAAANDVSTTNIHFVSGIDAFTGHEECTDDPYLNFLSLQSSNEQTDAGSFHPNQEGQAAYSSAIAAEMAQY